MKRSKPKSSAPKVDPFIEGLMSKLLDRLVVLEKKMDTVISQTSRSSNGDPHKPQRPQQAAPPRRERQLYEAICADCHKICEVPFRPTEARPVYCKECFAKRKSGNIPQKSPIGMPVITPLSQPPKPVSKLGMPSTPAPAPEAPAKKAKKQKSAKKAKKKK